jgi:hypothetical protein
MKERKNYNNFVIFMKINIIFFIRKQKYNKNK